MYSKTQAAFILSVKKLFEENTRCYFWTFTFREVMPDWYYPRSWDVFIKSLNAVYGNMIQGLRVLEVHPGGHGLHYHAIINKRVAVQIVRRFAARVGMGIVQVDTATEESAFYLAKYLCKSNPLWAGMRRWGTIGGFRQVKKNNIEIDSAFHRNWRQMNPDGILLPREAVAFCWKQTMLYGDWQDWDTPIYEKKDVDKIRENPTMAGDDSGVIKPAQERRVRIYQLDKERRCYAA